MSKYKNLIGILLLIVIGIIDSLVSCSHLKPAIDKDEKRIKSETADISSLDRATVLRVIDGDTYEIDINNKKTKVRLIGIDTPESVHADESKNTEEGKLVSDYVTDLLSDRIIYLEYDIEKKDYYGRTLAYVYTEDGQMVQDILLSKGYARVMTVQPNSKYSDHFLRIERTARKSEEGFWIDYFKEE